MKIGQDMKLILDDKEMTDEEKLDELTSMGYDLQDVLSFILKNYN